MRKLRSRLAELERVSDTQAVIVVFGRAGETSDQAIKREIAVGKFTEADRANRLTIVVTTFGTRGSESDM